MKILLLVCVAALLSYAGYEYARFRSLVIVSTSLIDAAKPFERKAGAEKMLVLGDSTGVGVGAARPEESVAGRIAALHPEWSVENYAVSGARVSDLPSQLEQVKENRYLLALVHIGGNDIIRLGDPDATAEALKPLLKDVASRADRVVFLSAGNVGSATLFPSWLRPFYHRRTLAFHKAFTAVSKQAGVTYVNLYTPPEEDPFIREPHLYLSEDGLHPSSEGYWLWFEKVRSAL